MKNTLLLIGLLICSSGLSAQSKLSGLYQLNGDLSSITRAHKIYISYRDKDGSHNDSTLVKNGHFRLNGFLDEPRTVNLFLVSSYNGKLSFKNLLGSCTVFLEPGVITLTAKDTVLNKPVITGSKINEEYEQFNALIETAKYKITKDYKKADSAQRVQIAAKMKQFWDEAPEKIYKPFFLAHLDSYISLYVLLEYAGTHIDAEKLEPWYNRLERRIQNTRLAIILKRRMDVSKIIGIGKDAPNFMEQDTAGKPISLSSYKGKYILLDFWASWCMPCRDENPSVVKAYHKYKDRNFTILSISVDRKKADWLKAVKEDQLEWTQLLEQKRPKSVSELYNIITIPQNFLIDPTGKIIAEGLRGEALDKKLEYVLGK